MIEDLSKKLFNYLEKFYQKRKDQFIIFTFLAITLLFLRINPIFPYYLTDRKMFYILSLIFLLVFRINSKGVALIGLFFLTIVIVAAFLGRLGAVDKVIIYAWGFFVIAVCFQIIELWTKRHDKISKS